MVRIKLLMLQPVTIPWLSVVTLTGRICWGCCPWRILGTPWNLGIATPSTDAQPRTEPLAQIGRKMRSNTFTKLRLFIVIPEKHRRTGAGTKNPIVTKAVGSDLITVG